MSIAGELIVGALIVALAAAYPSMSRAQDDVAEVAVVTTGEDAAPVAEAFAELVSVSAAHRIVGGEPTTVASAEGDETLGYVVSIDTEADVVQVLRRTDGARFERQFEAGLEDSYALALVAAELLEVARSGGDPVELGLAATVPREEAPQSIAADAEDDVTEDPERADAAPPEEPGNADRTAERRASPALSLGVGAEAWTSFGDTSPYHVQPTLFADLLTQVGARALLGGGLFVSAFGSYEGRSSDASVTYRRYDFGARLTTGLDVGAVRTRVLAHLRVGGALMMGDGRTLGLMNEQTQRETLGSFFVGLGLEARQPLVSGLELFLDAFVDLTAAPVTFVAFGETLVSESVLRLGARLGLAWRIQ